MKNKISVIVPNYNYSNFIGRRIDSILKQTEKIYELIILDDNSTDNSVEIINRKVEEIKKNNPNLKITTVFNEKNSGNVCLQWAKGFSIATGDFVWIAEMDDLAEENFLKENIKRLTKDEKILLSYTDSHFVDEVGKINPKRTIRRIYDKVQNRNWLKSYTRDGKDELSKVMCIFNTIPNVSAAVFRKQDFYEDTLMRAARYKIVGDWYFYVKILSCGKIAYINKKLNKYCIHDDSVTKMTKKKIYLDETKEMHQIISSIVKISSRKTKKMKKHEEYLAKIWGIEK